jgi:hypothetical protein
MFLWIRNLNYLILFMFFTAVVSCSGVPSSERPSWEEVKISDFNSVAGNWEGLTWMEPKSVREQNWANVNINADGTFKFSTYRTIGAWVGEGTLHIEDGKLVSPRSDQEGTITMTLFKGDGKRMLRVDATDKRGRIQRAELNPVQKNDRSHKS